MFRSSQDNETVTLHTHLLGVCDTEVAQILQYTEPSYSVTTLSGLLLRRRVNATAMLLVSSKMKFTIITGQKLITIDLSYL